MVVRHGPSAVFAASQMMKRSRGSRVPTVGELSPLANQYNTWSGVGSSGYQNPLPRPAETFTNAAFGPLTPIKPMGINQPPEGFDRPEPRRWPYPVGWDMPIGQPGSEGFKLANFQTLRTLGNLYSVARSCIRLRINELRGMAWDITPTKEAEKYMRSDHAAHKDFNERRDEAIKFFKRPDTDYHDFSSWFTAALEDVFVIDALSLYLQPTRGASTKWGKGKGLLGSNLAHLCLIDGSTVRPLVDVYGATPQPPAIGYQVYEYGVPRVDLMTLITDEDREELGEKPAAEYRGDQLLYLPYNPQRWTPYGFTAIEGAIIPVMSGLRKQKWQMDYFAEGTIPRAFVAPGDVSMTPGQVAELQLALNAIAGDSAWHHKIMVLPPGSKVDPMVNTELADQFDEIVMTQVCMGFDVMPMELGISPKVSATQSSGAAHQMAKASESINQRKSLKPMMVWLKSCIFDKILQDVCGQSDMEWRWEALAEGEDEEALISMMITQVERGLLSIDEARIELGRQPWGLQMTSDPGILIGAGFVPLGAIDPVTGAPSPQQPAMPGEAGVAQPTVGAPGEENTTPVPWAPPPVAPAPTAASAPNAPAARANTPTAPNAPAAKPVGAKPAPRQHVPATPGHTGGSAAIDREPPPNQGGSANNGKKSTGSGLHQGLVRDLIEKPLWQSDEIIKNERTTKRVLKQLLRDYPETALGWVKDADWTGPIKVSVDQIDSSNKANWQASHEPAKVERFKKRISRHLDTGKPVKPVTLIKTPGNHKLVVVDGHHRFLAYQALGEPVTAWIGTVKKDAGPWDIMHNQQFPASQRETTDDPDTGRSETPSQKAVFSELDALCRHLNKGRDIGTWECRYISGDTFLMVRTLVDTGAFSNEAVIDRVKKFI